MNSATGKHRHFLSSRTVAAHALVALVLFSTSSSVSAFSSSVRQQQRLLVLRSSRDRLACGSSGVVGSSSSGEKTLLRLAGDDNDGSSSSVLSTQTRITFDHFDRKGKGGLSDDEFGEALSSLDIDATAEERRALFSYLDSNGDGVICFDEFAEWYSVAVEAARSSSDNFRDVLMSRRTVNAFDKTPVSDDVLRRAIECAIAAPNRSGSEPWRFIKIGPETVEKLQDLNERVVTAGGEKVLSKQQSAPLLPDVWTEIPGWCVVTSKVSPDDPETELRDFRSVSCAMQNFMLSMWSEGVGSKWTEGPTQKTQQFADTVGIDTAAEKVVGIIWYGFTTGGLSSVDPKQQRKKGVDDVLSFVP